MKTDSLLFSRSQCSPGFLDRQWRLTLGFGSSNEQETILMVYQQCVLILLNFCFRNNHFPSNRSTVCRSPNLKRIGSPDRFSNSRSLTQKKALDAGLEESANGLSS